MIMWSQSLDDEGHCRGGTWRSGGRERLLHPSIVRLARLWHRLAQSEVNDAEGQTMIKKRIIAGALAGWVGIVATGWVMADDRIQLCSHDWSGRIDDPACLIRTTAARDYVLTSGLTIALIGAVVAAFAWSAVRSRNGNQRAIEARSPRAGDLMTRLASIRRSFNWRPRRPHVRVVLAMASGMIFTAGLLWWDGMIQPSQREGRERSPLVNASNPYADIPLQKARTGSSGLPILVPVEGDPFANLPIAHRPPPGVD